MVSGWMGTSEIKLTYTPPFPPTQKMHYSFTPVSIFPYSAWLAKYILLFKTKQFPKL